MSAFSVVCTNEPRGECGLEGFQRGLAYVAVERKTISCTPYYRVYPVIGDDYYESCSKAAFDRYFQRSE